VVQHFDAKPIVIGFDARETSPNRVAAAAQGAMDAGAKALSERVLDILELFGGSASLSL
tara:strand:- start:3906 stop:4082 length:177 start_codon:yes stop_codon:yes gene_type:complete